LALSGQRDLARIEYRLTISLGSVEAIREAFQFFPSAAEMLETVPDTPGPLVALGELLSGYPTELHGAQLVYEKLWTEHLHVASLKRLVELRLAMNEGDLAYSSARDYLRSSPRDPAAYVLASKALTACGKSAEALAVLEAGAAVLPGAADIQIGRASFASAAGRYSEARALIEEISGQDTTSLVAKHTAVARLLASQGRMLESLDFAREASREAPFDPGVYLTLAEVATAAGRLEEAIAALEHARGLPSATPGSVDERLRRLRVTLREQQNAQGLAPPNQAELSDPGH
jgi:tetratricopeptide (TPR) repeat protein